MYSITNAKLAKHYEIWLEKHKGNEQLIQKVNSLLKAAINEACIYDNAHESDPVNVLIQHIDQLACYSTEWDRGFRSTCPTYYTLISSNCIHCTLFSLLFYGIRVMLIIEPKYINEFQWESLRDVLPYTDLNHIVIKVDDYMSGSELENPLGKAVGKLWCLESDSCCAVVQEDHSYEATEHGWPVTMEEYYERFYPLTETETMSAKKREWYSQTKLSSEEACFGFMQKRKEYDEYRASRNRMPFRRTNGETNRSSKDESRNFWRKLFKR